MTQQELSQRWNETNVAPIQYSFWKGKPLSQGEMLARVDDDMYEFCERRKYTPPCDGICYRLWRRHEEQDG